MQLINQDAQDHGAGGTQRVTHGDRTTIDVDLVVWHFHFFHEAHDDGGKGLVDFKQIDLVYRHAGPRQSLARCGHGTGEHDGRIRTAECGRHNAGAWCQAMDLASGFGANQDRRRAIHNAAGVARMVHMLDAFDLRIARQCHLVKTHTAHLVKRGLQRGQAFESGLRLDELVFTQNHLPQGIFDSHQGVVKVAFGTRVGGAQLALQGKGIDVLS